MHVADERKRRMFVRQLGPDCVMQQWHDTV